MSLRYQLTRMQYLPVPVHEAWDFFSDPNNLLAITPPPLNLAMTSKPDRDTIYPGQVITYRVKPLFRIPLFWMTEITEVAPNKMFVDEQRKGPYAYWRHEHYFTPEGEGTNMKDIITYQLPLGRLGLIGLPIVKKQLEKIFAYRYQKIEELFGK